MSSRRRLRRKQCGQKLRHASRAAAQVAAAATIRRRPTLRGCLGVYHCGFCGSYHVGRKFGAAKASTLALERLA